jgi:hypothetical protein
MAGRLTRVILALAGVALTQCESREPVKLVAEADLSAIGQVDALSLRMEGEPEAAFSLSSDDGFVWEVEAVCTPSRDGHRIAIDARIGSKETSYTAGQAFECCDCWSSRGVMVTFRLRPSGEIEYVCSVKGSEPEVSPHLSLIVQRVARTLR